ncbi:MAG: phosphoenolpyruvate---glycerone phosphotransferase subunit DhaK [Chloroflexota bacterium]|jgi:dihydroxyacetone kinase-like protein|nr:phosphoenolpyruvate---glycerone phosphotransferase subunit DhaK [Chloroflexota bacterium]MEA2612533.1 phosphoenolpyruvate---glycerone phosphotransferase subunit DhaK [Chloroflexota bacterium]
MATNAPSRVKKLINDVEDIVPESLSGLQAAHPDIVKVDLSQNLVLRAGGPKKGKVALISGGGSGHEPLHGGFVGLGMLDAAAAGHVFTSPVPDQMEAATRAVDGGAGVLHIVKNYTGDVLNFQMAAELVAGDIEVATVVTNDDVAVQDSLYTAGRRGVGVTVLLEKIAGAQAEEGASLADVTATAVKVNDQGRSMGLALTSCVVPAAGTPTFELGDDEVEVGIGIHGEPGRRREKLAPVDDMAEWLVSPIVSDLGLSRGDKVLAFVNGMGGTPLIELYVAFNSVNRILGGQGISIGRSLVGNYITSLEMAGFSVTLLRLDDELTRLWDAPVHTAALRWRV